MVSPRLKELPPPFRPEPTPSQPKESLPPSRQDQQVDSPVVAEGTQPALETVQYHDVELIYPKDPKYRETPWADVLMAMKSFKNNCTIHICDPKVIQGDNDLMPPWDDWRESCDVEYGIIEYQYGGLTI